MSTNYKFLKSEAIKLYPTAYRGKVTHSDGKQYLLNPESKFNTEENITRVYKILGSHKIESEDENKKYEKDTSGSFIVSPKVYNNADQIEVIVNGYYFNINISELKTNEFIKVGDATNPSNYYLHIITKNRGTLSNSITQNPEEFKARNLDYPAKSLIAITEEFDNELLDYTSTDGSLRFHGLAISNDAKTFVENYSNNDDYTISTLHLLTQKDGQLVFPESSLLKISLDEIDGLGGNNQSAKEHLCSNVIQTDKKLIIKNDPHGDLPDEISKPTGYIDVANKLYHTVDHYEVDQTTSVEIEDILVYAFKNIPVNKPFTIKIKNSTNSSYSGCINEITLNDSTEYLSCRLSKLDSEYIITSFVLKGNTVNTIEDLVYFEGDYIPYIINNPKQSGTFKLKIGEIINSEKTASGTLDLIVCKTAAEQLNFKEDFNLDFANRFYSRSLFEFCFAGSSVNNFSITPLVQIPKYSYTNGLYFPGSSGSGGSTGSASTPSIDSGTSAAPSVSGANLASEDDAATTDSSTPLSDNTDASEIELTGLSDIPTSGSHYRGKGISGVQLTNPVDAQTRLANDEIIEILVILNIPKEEDKFLLFINIKDLHNIRLTAPQVVDTGDAYSEIVMLQNVEVKQNQYTKYFLKYLIPTSNYQPNPSTEESVKIEIFNENFIDYTTTPNDYKNFLTFNPVYQEVDDPDTGEKTIIVHQLGMNISSNYFWKQDEIKNEETGEVVKTDKSIKVYKSDIFNILTIDSNGAIRIKKEESNYQSSTNSDTFWSVNLTEYFKNKLRKTYQNIAGDTPIIITTYPDFESGICFTKPGGVYINDQPQTSVQGYIIPVYNITTGQSSGVSTSGDSQRFNLKEGIVISVPKEFDSVDVYVYVKKGDESPTPLSSGQKVSWPGILTLESSGLPEDFTTVSYLSNPLDSIETSDPIVKLYVDSDASEEESVTKYINMCFISKRQSSSEGLLYDLETSLEKINDVISEVTESLNNKIDAVNLYKHQFRATIYFGYQRVGGGSAPGSGSSGTSSMVMKYYPYQYVLKISDVLYSNKKSSLEITDLFPKIIHEGEPTKGGSSYFEPCCFNKARLYKNTGGYTTEPKAENLEYLGEVNQLSLGEVSEPVIAGSPKNKFGIKGISYDDFKNGYKNNSVVLTTEGCPLPINDPKFDVKMVNIVDSITKVL